MIFSFEQLKKMALRGRDRSKGKKLSYSEYLFYDSADNAVVCYRPKYLNPEDHKTFRVSGYDPERSTILAYITPKKFEMGAYFHTLGSERIRKFFNVNVLPISSDRFLKAFAVQASDFNEIITEFPATYVYGKGFRSFASPQMLKFDPEKRKALNNLIRKKRHMLRTRAKLGASFAVTPAQVAKNIVYATKYPTKHSSHIYDRYRFSPYLHQPFAMTPQIHSARLLLDLLDKASADNVESLSTLMAFQQITFTSALGKLKHGDLNIKDIPSITKFTKIIEDDQNRFVEQYNEIKPTTKYDRFEQTLARLKPLVRLAYGADYYEAATQVEAKEALGEAA